MKRKRVILEEIMKSKLLQKKEVRQLLRDFFWVFVFGMAAHAFCYFNANFSHDSMLVSVLNDHEIDTEIATGRFLQPLYRYFRGNVALPWVIGFLSLIYLSFSSFFIQQIIDTKSKISQVLICACVSVNISFTLINATYIPWADIYMLAFLAATMSVWLLRKYSKGWIPGIICVTFVMCTYQPYITVVFTLLVLLFIKFIMDGTNIKEKLILVTKGCGMSLFGGILYKISYEAVLSITGVEKYDGYNALGNMFNMNGYHIGLLKESVGKLAELLVVPGGYLPVWAALGNIVAIAIGLCCFIFVVINRKMNAVDIIFSILSLVFLPFIINITYILSKGETHEITEIAYIFIYILEIMSLERFLSIKKGIIKLPKKAKKAMVYMLCFGIGLSTWNGIVYANGAYLKKDLEAKSTLSTMTRVLEFMEDVDGYIPGETEVIMAGNMPGGNRLGFDRYDKVGVYHNFPVTYNTTFEKYFTQILDRNLNMASIAVSTEYKAMEKVKKMPAFPDEGCCKIIKGRLVVKLSNY